MQGGGGAGMATFVYVSYFFNSLYDLFSLDLDRQLQADWNLWSSIGKNSQNKGYKNHNQYDSRGSNSQWDNNPYKTHNSNINNGNWGNRQPGQGGPQDARGRGHGFRPDPMSTGIQPKPGVHPDDWGRVNTNIRGTGDDVGWTR